MRERAWPRRVRQRGLLLGWGAVSAAVPLAAATLWMLLPASERPDQVAASSAVAASSVPPLDLPAAWQLSGLPEPPKGWIELQQLVLGAGCARADLEGSEGLLKLRLLTAVPAMAERLRGVAGHELDAGIRVEPVPAGAPICPLLDVLNRTSLASPFPLARLEAPLERRCIQPPCYAGIRERRLAAGERLVLAVTGPPASGFLAVDMVRPDGAVLHLYPPSGAGGDTDDAARAPAEAGDALWIGDARGPGGNPAEVTVGEPFGRYYVITRAAAVDPRDPSEPSITRLDGFVAALAGTAAGDGSPPPLVLASVLTLEVVPAVP